LVWEPIDVPPAGEPSLVSIRIAEPVAEALDPSAGMIDPADGGERAAALSKLSNPVGTVPPLHLIQRG
jgi:hypothetical protein